MLAQLDTYDWEEAFKYASPTECRDHPQSVIGKSVNTDPFTRDDVVKIFGMVEGENDGPEWIVFGRLRDGRYFCLRAGCDYTGWG